MAFKVIAGILAAGLMMVYIGVVVLKLREPALSVVVAVGLIMMLIDLWESLKSKNDE